MNDFRRKAKLLIQWSVVLATVIVLIKVGRDQQAGLQKIDLQFDLWLMLSAGLASTVANLLLPLGWRRILNSLNNDLPINRAVRLWCLAQTGRYLPTGLLAIASRVSLAAKEGISRAVTISSLAIETTILFGWALLACGAFVPSSVLPATVRGFAIIASTSWLFASCYLIPRINNRLAQTKSLEQKSQSRFLANAVLLLGSSVAMRAIGTACLAAGFFEISFDSLPLIIGASYAAVVAGMVGITPAGLGVREGVMTAILASHLGFGDAAAFALLTRAWEFIFEMFFLVAATWWGRTKRKAVHNCKDSVGTEGKL